MNWKSFMLGVIIGLIVGFLIFSNMGNRYYVALNDAGGAIKINKWTGQTWRLGQEPFRWVPLIVEESKSASKG
ncbi:hypothetical protein KAX22_00640 [bacterium]|nr:hypothetical protein [bacterium]